MKTALHPFDIAPVTNMFAPAGARYVYQHSDKVDPPESFQLEDMQTWLDRDNPGDANWSEMGAKKTSTALWYIQRRWRELGHPKTYNMLVVTTRSGKGTYYKLAPEIMRGWTIIDVGTAGMSVLKNGELKKLPKVKFVPKQFNMPTLVVTHFNIFSRSNKDQPETDKEGNVVFETAECNCATGDITAGEYHDSECASFTSLTSVKMKPPSAADHIVSREWDFVIVDEAHRIKDKDAKWTVLLKRATRKRSMVMTGTGFINRPDEVWSPLNFIDKYEFGGFWRFYEDFCEIDDWSGYSRVTGCKPEKQKEFRALVRKYGPRRTLDEVMPHLKKPLFVPSVVDLNPIQRKMYNDIRSELKALDQQGVELYAANVLSLLTRLRGICVATPEVVEDRFDEWQQRRIQKIKLVEPSSKLDECIQLIENLEWDEDRRDCVVVFSNFVGPLQLLEKRFNKANANCIEMGLPPEFPYIWLKESDKDEQRYNKWARLFPTKEFRVFMSTLQIGGESISLTVARHVIFLDRSWSPKDNDQGVGRLRRPGQTGQPIVIHINARNTTDQHIEHVNNIKKGWFSEIFGNEK